MNLSDSVKLKLNGTFARWLYLLDENNCIYCLKYRVQTALFLNSETGKWNYISIFPDFIKRYCPPSLNLLEYISCYTGKDEFFYKHIDDPKGILDCEDLLTSPIVHIEKDCKLYNYSALLNSKYTAVYNRPLTVTENKLTITKRYPLLYALILTARQFFGKQEGVLSLVNSVMLI